LQADPDRRRSHDHRGPRRQAAKARGIAAILLLERDAIGVVGALVVGELYGLECPVALANKRDWDEFAAAARLVVEAGPAETMIGIVP